MMNNYNFNVIEEKNLSKINGGYFVIGEGGSGSGSNYGGDDAGAFGLWELVGHFGGR